MAMYLRKAGSGYGLRAVKESIVTARVLETTMRPKYPIEMHANAIALAQLEREKRPSGLWTMVNATLDVRLQQMLDDRGHVSGRDPWLFEAYLFKLSTLLATSFSRALFVDSDMHVRQPELVHVLLHSTLEFSDIAAPVDTGRNRWLVDIFDKAPPLCSCLMAFRNTPSIKSVWRGAARRLVDVAHPGLRQGDQEMIYFEWIERRRDLRVLLLPEEWYCPLRGAGGLWKSPHGEKYQCRAMHAHGQKLQTGGSRWHSYKAALLLASQRSKNATTAPTLARRLSAAAHPRFANAIARRSDRGM